MPAAQVAAETSYLVPVYVTYAAASLGLTIWLARTLSTNGAVFLEDVFKDHPRLAESVNKLLVVGFYLVNFGYALLILKAQASSSVVEAIETLAFKLGALLLSLAVMHFANLLVFHRIRRRAQMKNAPPPVSAFMSVGPQTSPNRFGPQLPTTTQGASAHVPAAATTTPSVA